MLVGGLSARPGLPALGPYSVGAGIGLRGTLTAPTRWENAGLAPRRSETPSDRIAV